MNPGTVPDETSPQQSGAFTSAEQEFFTREGYIIVRGLADQGICEEIRAVAEEHLSRRIRPWELEATLHYPGAPVSQNAEGGNTIRRLLQAQSRHPVFTRWLSLPGLTRRLHQLLGSEVVMPLAHHNCIMTKQPRFSSDTGWHRDIRYWSFERPELITAWLAMGSETPENGGLQVIPGSHRMHFDTAYLDDASFLRTDIPETRELIRTRKNVALQSGDVLFFHCRTLHRANRNRTDQTKLSVVFTFRPGDNRPLPHTRSVSLPELLIKNYPE
jgi:phytanoyl-CoA hydroxylase